MPGSWRHPDLTAADVDAITLRVVVPNGCHESIVQEDVLVVAGGLLRIPVEVAASDDGEGSLRSVVTRGDQAWQLLVTHVEVAPDHVFRVVVVAERPMIGTVEAVDRPEGTVRSPAEQVAASFRAVVAATVRVDIRLEVVQPRVDHALHRRFQIHTIASPPDWVPVLSWVLVLDEPWVHVAVGVLGQRHATLHRRSVVAGWVVAIVNGDRLIVDM